MKKIFFILVLCISILAIIHLITSIYILWHKQDVLINAENQLKQEQSENAQLHHQLSIVGSSSFLDEEARNELFMVKPGEQEVIIPPNLLPSAKGQKIAPAVLPTWEQWIKLFFH